MLAYKDLSLRRMAHTLRHVNPFAIAGPVVCPHSEGLRTDEWDMFAIDDAGFRAGPAVIDRASAIGIDVAYDEAGDLVSPMRDDALAPDDSDDLDACLACLLSGGRLVQLPDDPHNPSRFRWYPVVVARDLRRFRHVGDSDLRPLGGGSEADNLSGADTYLGSVFGYEWRAAPADAYHDLYLRTTRRRDLLGVRWGNGEGDCAWALAADCAAPSAPGPFERAYARAKRWALLRGIVDRAGTPMRPDREPTGASKIYRSGACGVCGRRDCGRG